MSLTTCTILVNRQPGKTVIMSRTLAKALQVSSGRTVTLRLGSKETDVTVRTSATRKDNELVLPANLTAQLRLPRTGKCYIRSQSGKELQLGPVIGILTHATPEGGALFGSRTSFFREIFATGEGKAFHVAFSPSSVNWEDGTVYGYTLDRSGKWVRKTFPMPDVVYNRLPSRKAEKSASMEAFKERFVRRRIPLFNWSFFDKWDVYKLLDGESEAEKHVPESLIDPSPDDIRRMMEKHRFVYLKPTGGSLGIGIYRLTYSPGRGYFARFRRNGSNVLIRFGKFDGLMKLLRRHNIQLRHYVIQQGIRLIELDGCPLDFRFHMVKNGNNQWVAAGIGAKRAGRGSVTTHIRNGGELMTPEHALTRVYGSSKAEEILTTAKQAAIRLAEAIEKRYSHPLGELGFDLGIDQNDRVWMFEANAKPGRSIFKHPSLKAQGRATLTNLFEHCLYLARFRTRREG
ncbi:YheC/YheD family endospore coat-associated protein [Gorillibacterium sp. sgz5001074]|uniref:YheC/YheD family endospore coat-associated protein n=1 Tax=Gorillibacterium sp. sgz5001074 TaxID=3446695 RepID=UPI003F678398